ncbi:MAG: L,D-transpeptidase [Verrucomicrobia bacterium]|nr:L,D-transpeptidase [Kiritimatiellia bacterium]MCO6401002.1 L,D-transpeptidase [Verrucomicrobiota bacterium]
MRKGNKSGNEGLATLPERSLLLVVSPRTQTMELRGRGRLLKTYRISTSRVGLGQTPNSYRTPTGLHRVVRWIGEGRPLGAVFVGRRFTGTVLPPTAWRSDAPNDSITTRILRLRGLERGHNAGPGCDTYARFVYIHGTNHEQLLGQPASAGCVRMGNRDVADLFRRTRGHPTFCLIQSDD